MPILPFPGNTRPVTGGPAEVRSLWAERQWRKLREAEEVQIWRCICGCRSFEIIRYTGPRCAHCHLPADPPRER